MSKEPMNSFAGKWALITGASSGLGLDFADLLAAQNVNLVWAARRRINAPIWGWQSRSASGRPWTIGPQKTVVF